MDDYNNVKVNRDAPGSDALSASESITDDPIARSVHSPALLAPSNPSVNLSMNDGNMLICNDWCYGIDREVMIDAVDNLCKTMGTHTFASTDDNVDMP